MNGRIESRSRSCQRAALPLAVLLLGGCSLLTIKSPEVPLTPREQEARLLTRDYAAHFTATFEHAVDDSQRNTGDPAEKSRALRLKLGAVTQITRTSTGLSPMASLLDTWAFAVQLRDFLVAGPGADLLGADQTAVRQSALQLASEADELARKVTADDYSRYQTFVADYARRHPLATTDMVRPSVLTEWSSHESDKSLLRSVGTVAQALGDVSDRMRIYSERVPSISLWQAEVALDKAGFDDAAYQTALKDAEADLQRISRLADASPELVRESIGQMRASLREASERLDNSSMQALRTLRTEREALTADLAAERQNIAAIVDVQRARISAEAGQIAERAVDTSWREARRLVREALLLLILLAIVMLGLPFAAGYFVGRRRGSPDTR